MIRHKRIKSGLVGLILLGIFAIFLFVIIMPLAWCNLHSKPLKIGFAGTLSGRLSDLGVAVRNGVTLAVEEINDGGGIGGRKLELVIADDQNDPELAVAAVENLLEEKVVAAIGHTTSAMSSAVLPLINKRKLPMISPTSTANFLSGLDDYFFRVCQPNEMEARMHASIAYEVMGIERMAVIYDTSNLAYTEDWFNIFEEEYVRLGGWIAGPLFFHAEQVESYAALAATLVTLKGEGLLIIASAVDTAVLCQQLHKQGAQMPIFTSGWAKTDDLLERGGKAVEGLIISHVFDAGSEAKAYLEFKEAYLKRFGREPDFAAVFGYDATYLLADVLERSEKYTPEVLREVLLEPRTYQGLQGEFSLDKYGDPHREYFLFTVKNGRFVRMEPAMLIPRQQNRNDLVETFLDETYLADGIAARVVPTKALPSSWKGESKK